MFKIMDCNVAYLIVFFVSALSMLGCRDGPSTEYQEPNANVASGEADVSNGNLVQNSAETGANRQRVDDASSSNGLQPKQVLSAQALERMSLAEVKTFASKGDPAAQLQLATSLLMDVENRTSQDEMAPIISLMKQASDQGYEPAVLGLANLYLVGLGVEKDRIKAEALIRNAMLGGSGKPEANLGMLLLSDEKYLEAAELFADGAKKGDVTSQIQLGQMLVRKQITQKTYGPAERYFMQAVAQGSDEAMFAMGELNMTAAVLGASESKAVSWYQRAAAKGHSVASYNLGVIAAKNQDMNSAAHHFEIAAEAGNVDAMMNYGVILFHLGDYANSERWLQIAVEHGSVESIQRLHTVRRQRALIGR